MEMQILLRKLTEAYLKLSTCLLLRSVKLPDGLLLKTSMKCFLKETADMNLLHSY